MGLLLPGALPLGSSFLGSCPSVYMFFCVSVLESLHVDGFFVLDCQFFCHGMFFVCLFFAFVFDLLRFFFPRMFECCVGGGSRFALCFFRV